MKKFAICFILLIFSSINIFAQDLRKTAEENPLNCAFYLASVNSDINLNLLAATLFDFGRFDDAVRVVNFENGEYLKVIWMVSYSANLIKLGRKDKAHEFLDKTLEDIKNGAEYEQNLVLIFLASPLIELGRENDAFSLINIAESKFDDNQDKAQVRIGVSQAFLAANQNENALKVLQGSFEIAEPDQKAEIIELYLKLNQTKKAHILFSDFEKSVFANENAADFKISTLSLIKANISVGRTEKAIELWKQNSDEIDNYEFSQIIESLIKFGEVEKARLYLNQEKSNPETLQKSRKYIVDNFLKLNDIESALESAKLYSTENDDYSQQTSLVKIADKLIENKQNQAALDILEYAFQKAGKIKYQEIPMSSIGADPASRKTIYLREIFNRFVKLKRFDRALFVINSFENKPEKAKKLIEFAKLQIKTLPQKKLYEILNQAQTLVTDDTHYYQNLIRISAADVYAQIGNKTKAVQLLTKVLEENEDASYYLNDFLVLAGKVFAENNLKADANMQKILLSLIENAE